MPKSKKKNSSQTKPAAKRKAGGKKSGGNGGGQMSSAPSAVSDMLRQHVKFSGTGDTLVISGLIALANVGTPATASETSGGVDGAGTPFYAQRLSPTAPQNFINSVSGASGEFISPALDLLGSAFSRYRALKTKFHYRPQSGTNSTQQLVFAFANDPCHPLIFPSEEATLPTTAGLESLADSIPFAPWAGWSLDVSKKLTKEWLYTAVDATGEESAHNTTARFSSFGTYGLVVGTASTSTAVNYGVLYMEFSLEFREFCPISATRPASLLKLMRKLELHHSRRCLQKATISDMTRRVQAVNLELKEKGDPIVDPCSFSSSPTSNIPIKYMSGVEFREEVRALRMMGVGKIHAARHIADHNDLSGDAESEYCRIRDKCRRNNLPSSNATELLDEAAARLPLFTPLVSCSTKRGKEEKI